MLSYAWRVSELEQMVKRMVFESYGVEKYYNSHFESTTYLFRLIKYRVPSEINESNVGCHVHTDKSFITILHQNEVEGLEFKTKDGDCWIGFEPSPSSFLGSHHTKLKASPPSSFLASSLIITDHFPLLGWS